jgi:hypothetical protein
MKFYRFSGCLSNWGWYSPAENRLLKKEKEAGDYVDSLEDFVRATATFRSLVSDFRAIQLNTKVKVGEYAEVERRLDFIVTQLAEKRLRMLDKGGAKIPDSVRIFPNHQPTALIGEIQNYLAARRIDRMNPDTSAPGFVIHFGAATALAFRAKIQSGGKVLYTVDVDHILSIGDPRTAKHSVVAVGKDCIAAGIAQLEIDERMDIYLSVQNCRDRGNDLKRQMDSGATDPSGSLKENYLYLMRQADQLEIGLQGYIPPPIVSDTVAIDFDSGHYAPSGAWKEAMAAWHNAGYTAKWSRTSRRT